MDLIALVQHVPSLLECCISNDTQALSRLRLVSKESSRIALLGLKSYTVNLHNASSLPMRLLEQMQLRAFRISLVLSEATSSCKFFRNFVAEAGQLLRCVTSLDLDLSGEEWDPTSGLLLLMQACPCLASLTTRSLLTPAFFSNMGRLCPRLSSLTMFHSRGPLPKLEKLLLLLPHLALRLIHCNEIGYIPDMSKYPNILALVLLGFKYGAMHSDEAPPMTEQGLWLRLPPKLQHLRCGRILVGPPAFKNGTPTLPELISVQFSSHIDIHLLAELLHAAPALRSLSQSPDLESESRDLDPNSLATSNFTIYIRPPFTPSTAADLSTIQQRLKTGLLMQATFRFRWCCGYQEKNKEESFPDFLEALPCMSHVSTCIFEGVPPTLLTPLLRLLPNVTDVRFHHMLRMDDISLQHLAMCPSLKKMSISCVHGVSPMGLQTLCHRLPALHQVNYRNCALLNEPGMQQCMALLKKHGLHVKMVQSTIYYFS